MTGPSISEQREAVRRGEVYAAYIAMAGQCLPRTRLYENACADQAALRAATETLAVVEWMQRTSPHGWAREVTLYKRAQAELAAMDKQEGRGDG